MAKAGGSGDGCASGIGGAIFFILVLIAAVPKPVWIVLGILTATAVVVGVTVKAFSAYEKHRAAAEEQARVARAAQAAAAKREREEKARQRKRERIKTLGPRNAELVESALAAVQQIIASEANRAGWLGDVDFTPDVRAIAENFQKAHALSKVAGELSKLDKPSADDRKILAEAKATAAELECAAIERVELIRKCATEARLVDESLRTEREDEKTAEQRAELHAKLSAMLYGIEATPNATPTDSAADAVMARVQAYLEIKNQIQRTRNDGSG